MNYLSSPPQPSSSSEIITYSARDLIQNGQTVKIILDEQTYTLRITRAGKLILTK
jgi:hemin uptake protein HemP